MNRSGAEAHVRALTRWQRIATEHRRCQPARPRPKLTDALLRVLHKTIYEVLTGSKLRLQRRHRQALRLPIHALQKTAGWGGGETSGGG